jgi:hypothetical protein
MKAGQPGRRPRLESDPNLHFHPNPRCLVRNNQHVNASLKVFFACDQSSELFQAHSRALGSD